MFGSLNLNNNPGSLIAHFEHGSCLLFSQQLLIRRTEMNKALLTSDQVRQLINSWKDSISGSEEQKLIEDLFLITGTPMPLKSGATEQ